MESGEPSVTTNGTWCPPVWSAESWASGLLKRLSRAPGWGKVRNGVAEGMGLSPGENMVLGTPGPTGGHDLLKLNLLRSSLTAAHPLGDPGTPFPTKSPTDRFGTATQRKDEWAK